MKMSWPATILLGMVVGVIAFAGGNADSADEADAARTPESGQPADADDAGDQVDQADDRGSADAQGLRDAAPDTGEAALPNLPSGSYVVVLTFDDGPDPTYTPQVLDLLAAHDAKAVFCVVGEQVNQHPELIRRIVDEGHALCNHTFTHDPELASRPESTINEEIADTSDAIANAVSDPEIPFFRQPAMYVTPEVAPVAHRHGLTLLDWTVDPRDWDRPGTSTIVERVMEQIGPGSVVLLHDGGGVRSQTVQATKQILATLDAAGYETVIPETD